MIDNTIENDSNQTREEYLSKNEFETNDIINFNSPRTYDEHPKEFQYDDIEMFEDLSIFDEFVVGDYYENQMTYDHSPPTYDEYYQESDCDGNNDLRDILR